MAEYSIVTTQPISRAGRTGRNRGGATQQYGSPQELTRGLASSENGPPDGRQGDKTGRRVLHNSNALKENVGGLPVGDNGTRTPSPAPSLAPTNWFAQHLDEILDLTDQVASVALFGSIGIGKSFVARAVLDHNRTKAKFGENRYSMCCDNLPSSPGAFMERSSELIHVEVSCLQTRLRSSPALMVLLDGVDPILDPSFPDAEEIHATIEEFGSYEHVCFVTTSRIYPDIRGFHRVEVPVPTEHGAREIFYGLCNLDRSAAMDTLIAKLDFHPFSIGLLAEFIRENGWDEQTLLKAWDDQEGTLRTTYYRRLGDVIEPVFRSPEIKALGAAAQDVLGAIAVFPSGIEEYKLEGIFFGTAGIGEVVDALCKFSLVHRRGGVVKMLSPFQFYFLESMFVYAQTEEVIKWGPDCMPAKACESSLEPFRDCGITVV